MIRITLSPDQRRQLEQGRRYQSQIAERCHYVLLNDQGHSVPQIAKRLERTEQTVRTWLKAYQREGIEGLSDAPRPGRPPLKGQALDQQLEILLNLAPADFGYPEAAWTVGLIRHHLANCQLEVSDSTVRRHLQGGGWLYKRFALVPKGAPNGAEKEPGWQTRRARPSLSAD